MVVAIDQRAPVAGLRVIPLSEVEPRPVRWIWDHRLAAGTLNLIAGPEGVGKSTFLAWLTRHFTRGTLPGDKYGTPGAVLIAALEDDLAATLRPRMEAEGADLSLVAYIDGPDGSGLRLPEHLEMVRQAMASFHPGLEKLVIVDPIKSTTGIKTRDESEVRPFLQTLLDFAPSASTTVIGSAHFKKGAKLEDFAAWKVSGDPAWTQVPRSVLFFDEDPEADEGDTDARLIAHAKCNLARRQETLTARVVTALIDGPDGQIETSRMILGGVSSISADQLGKRDREQHTAQHDAEDFLKAFLSDGQEHESTAIKTAARSDGHNDSALKRAARKLEVVQRREGSGAGHRSLWSLPNSDRSGPSDPSGPSQRPQTLTRVTQSTQATQLMQARPGESFEQWDARISAAFGESEAA